MKNLSNPRFQTSLLSLASLLSLFVLAAQAAEVPHLLADINTQPPQAGAFGVAEPSGFFTLNGRLLFSTASPDSEDDGILWSTDGTPAGTVQVSSSLCASPCGGISLQGVWRDRAYLFTSPEQGYPQLWRTDGTAAGTATLRDPSGKPENFISFLTSPELGALYFVGDDSNQELLWVSDGTTGGTRPLLGTDGYPFQIPLLLTPCQGRLCFIAYREVPGQPAGLGLWSTDGTPEGTRLLSSEIPHEKMVATPSHLFFDGGPAGEDLWVTDGTPGGAHQLLDLPPPFCTAPPESECDEPDILTMTAFGDTLYFWTQRPGHNLEIWRSDGTEAGTKPAIELPGVGTIGELHPLGNRWIFSSKPAPLAPDGEIWTIDAGFTQAAPLTGCAGGPCPSVALFLTPLADGQWIFAGDDPVHGTEPWVTDGTGPGTRLLADTCPGDCSGLDTSSPTTLLQAVVSSPYGGVYFRPFLDDQGHGPLWLTDGTPEGTRQVSAISSGLGFFGGRAWFGQLSPDGSLDLWKTDGTPDRTRPAVRLRRFFASSSPLFLPSAAGASFLADDGSGALHLWASDGTPEGTSELRGFALAPPRGLGGAVFTRAGGLTYFDVTRQQRSGSYAYELWRTDGTPAGTRPVLALGQRPITTPSVLWGDRLLVPVIEVHGCSLWITDGTPAGPRQFLPALPDLRCPTVLAPLSATRLLFVARVESPHGPVPQIFVTDGTVAGTRRISDLHGTRDPLEDQAVELGGAVFFRIINTDGNPELWRSDGTPAGTRPVSGLAGLRIATPPYLFRGALYFLAYPSGAGYGLFRLPAGGPPQVLETEESFSPPEVVNPTLQVPFAPLGDRLLFSVEGDVHGHELWITDGTSAGTHLVRDLRPGPGSSTPAGLVPAGGRVFFSADDGTHGRELWESDGTPAGTRMVVDLAPGGYSSILFPSNLAVANGYLFFAADDGTTGPEPWALRLE